VRIDFAVDGIELCTRFLSKVLFVHKGLDFK